MVLWRQLSNGSTLFPRVCEWLILDAKMIPFWTRFVLIAACMFPHKTLTMGYAFTFCYPKQSFHVFCQSPWRNMNEPSSVNHLASQIVRVTAVTQKLTCAAAWELLASTTFLTCLPHLSWTFFDDSHCSFVIVIGPTVAWNHWRSTKTKHTALMNCLSQMINHTIVTEPHCTIPIKHVDGFQSTFWETFLLWKDWKQPFCLPSLSHILTFHPLSLFRHSSGTFRTTPWEAFSWTSYHKTSHLLTLSKTRFMPWVGMHHSLWRRCLGHSWVISITYSCYAFTQQISFKKWIYFNSRTTAFPAKPHHSVGSINTTVFFYIDCSHNSLRKIKKLPQGLGYLFVTSDHPEHCNMNIHNQNEQGFVLQ